MLSRQLQNHSLSLVVDGRSRTFQVRFEMFDTLVVGQLSISAVFVYPVAEVILALKQIRAFL